MPLIETNSATERYRDRCEDRVHVIHTDKRSVIIVADGAGGVGSGDTAAEDVVRKIESHYKSIHSENDWVSLLRQIDLQIDVGESTAVVVDVRPYGIAGASVGDSRAWIVNGGQINDLTANQIRKPLIGSGSAQPVGFSHHALEGLLMVATDGFFNYAKRDDIIRLVVQTDFFSISRKCIELVRLPAGELWDDVGIVIGRNKPQPRTRQTYDI